MVASLFRRYAVAPLTFIASRSSPFSVYNIRGGARNFTSMAAASVDYHCVHVFISVKPGTEAAFKEASLANARNSAQEDGVARFDVLQDKEDPCQFVLVEVYKNADKAPAAHKETAHYAAWRETVADMMAVPRTARKFDNLFPTTASGWDYGDSKLE